MNKRPSLIRFPVLLASAAVLLAACGDASTSAAVNACKAEVLGKIEGKMGELNEQDMLAKARKLEDGNIQVDSSITYRRGTEQESTQTFNCTVAADDAGEYRRVVRMSINW